MSTFPIGTEKSQAGPGSGVLGAPVVVKPGMEFTHNRLKDLDWRPGAGQKYADAPLARMKVTARRNGLVYYTYANDQTNKAGWHECEADFIATFGDQLTDTASSSMPGLTSLTSRFSVGTMVRFAGKIGEITAVNRTRYRVLGTDGRSYTVPFSLAERVDADGTTKPSDLFPTMRTFRIGDKVVTHAPGSKYHGIKGEIVKINTKTVKSQPADGGLPISGPANLFRFQEDEA